MIDAVECKGCYRRMQFTELKCDDILDRYCCPHCGHGDFRILPTTTAEWNKIKDEVIALAQNLQWKMERGELKDDEFINKLVEFVEIIVKHHQIFPRAIKILGDFVAKNKITEGTP